MTTKRLTPFTVGRGFAGTWQGDALVEVSANCVPTLLHRLQVYTLRFPYDTEEDYAEGYQFHVKQQEALLMDIGDRLISEVRALRDGIATAEAAKDPTLDPYTLPLYSLRALGQDVDDNTLELGAKLDTATVVLQDILAAVQAQGGGEGIIERLDTLIVLLGAI